MITFESITLKNIATYQQVSFPLDLEGITVIRGQNRDTREKDNSNAVGKTVLFSSIPNVCYFEPPGAVKRNSAKELLRSGSNIELKFKSGKNSVSITQTCKGNSVKYAITKNDLPQKVRTVARTKAQIAKLFPLSKEQYYSTVYLNALTSSTLLRGTGAERMALFENLFPLEAFDLLYEHFKQQAVKAKEASIAYQTLSDELSHLPVSNNLKFLKKKLVKASKNLKNVQGKVESALAEHSRLDSACRMLARITHFLPENELVSKIKKAKSFLKSLENTYQSIISLEIEWETYKETLERRSVLKTKLKSLPRKPIDTDKLKANLDNSVALLRAYKDDLPAITEYKKQFPALKVALKAAKLLKVEPNLALETLKNQEKSLSLHIRQHASDNAICSACGSELNVKQRKKAKKALLAQLETVKRHKELLNQYINLYSAQKLAEKYQNLDYKAELSNVKELNSAYKSALSHNSQVREAEKFLAALEALHADKPKSRPDKPSSALKSELIKHRLELEEYRASLNILQGIKDLGISLDDRKSLNKRLKSLNKRLESLRITQIRWQTTHSELDIEYNQQESLSLQRKSLIQRVSEHRKNSKDFENFKILAEAYGPKGLRTNTIETLVEQYILNLNKLVPDLYRESYEFSCKVQGRDIQILVARNKQMPTDVRLLSGFEGRIFSIASIVALLPLLPSKYRTSLLILDEMETTLSAANRKRLASDILPKIAQYISSIYVITAHSVAEFHIPNARELLVVKENNVATVQGLV